MLKKYVAKFTMDILPSVVATIIGAYIVNHYIVTKPGADAPVASAVSTADPKAAPEVVKADAKPDDKAPAKAREISSAIVNAREPGVKAKGISEKAILEKSAAEKPQDKSQEVSQEKSGENAADKPAETAAIPVETRRHPSAPREKAVARTVPVPAPAVAPVVSEPVPVAPADAASAPEERRDANVLARAAIERLRGANEASPRATEAARTPDAARVPDAAHVVAAAPAVRPLPPPIMVSTPPIETRVDDPSRPTPPADIPSRPLDLRAEAAGPAVREHTTVAEDVLSAAKSVFHAVLPK